MTSLENSDWEKLVNSLVKQGILYSPRVIKAMRSVPRSKFLPVDKQAYSAVDTPIPIGLGQTVSAPHDMAFSLLGDTWFA